MQKTKFPEVVDLIFKEDPRFEKGAYYFVRQALDHTLKTLSEKEGEIKSNHVSGKELLDGIRAFAVEQYGPLVLTVFHHWNVRQCGDFGEIVFNLVDYGVLGRTPQDKKEDFIGRYEFEEAFVEPFLSLKRKRARQSAGR
ncbi:MAG: Minf_1886 family protein [Opitutales bacterium]